MNESGQYVGIALLAVGVICGVLYLFLPMVLPGKFCPAISFARGPMGSDFLEVCGIILSVNCYVLLTIGLWPRTDGKPRFKYQLLEKFTDNYRRIFLIGTVCGLGIGGVLQFNTVDSYFCLMPSDIFLHPSAFAEARSLTWDDVTKVRAECVHTRGGSGGGLTISFRDEQPIWAPLGRGDGPYAQEFTAIRKALQGHSYIYVKDVSVVENGCPRNVYPWFASQLGRQD